MESLYTKYRGKCREMSEALVSADSTLTLVRGHYYCPIWSSVEPHWWCKKSDGTIVDPTALQFPSAGTGVYEEFDGYAECDQCGVRVKEENAKIDGRYAFCSTKCHMIFVGL